MREITLKELLEAGCHFGHQTNRWHPKANSYIFDQKDGIHIIDLGKTRDGLIAAGEYLRNLAKNNGSVVVVGTKRQAQEIVKGLAARVSEAQPEKSNFYVLTERWPGGLLTNFDVIRKNNFDTILKLRDDIANNRFVTKKEKLLAQRKLDRYEGLYGGLVGLTKLPDAILVIDVKKEQIAVKEAGKTGVTMVAITDTNVNPEPVDYPIAANDDAVGSVTIIMEYLTDAWIEGLSEREKLAEEVEIERKATLAKKEKEEAKAKKEAEESAEEITS